MSSDNLSMTSVMESLHETSVHIMKDKHKNIYNSFIEENMPNVKKVYPMMNNRERVMYISLMWDIKQTNNY